jgi:hypothetical protein
LNNFTKEDLNNLIELFELLQHENKYSWFPDLKNKIQLIVNSYCDHVESYEGYDLCPINRCKKCYEELESFKFS